MTKNNAYLLLLVLLIGQFGSTFAQKVDPNEVAIYAAQYPEEQAIFLKYYQDVDIQISGDSLLVTAKHLHETLHLGTKSNVYAKDGIYSSSFYKTNSISAKTLIPDKRKFTIIPVTEFKDSFDKNSNIFYDDSKFTNFIFPAVQPGAHTILEYEQQIKDPKFLSSFLFQNYLPVAHSKYTVTIDKGIDMFFDIVNDPNGMVKRNVVQTDNRTTYIFEYENAEKLRIEGDAPAVRYTAPHVVSIVKEYAVEGEKIKVLSTTDDLFAWYSQFIKGLKDANYDNIKQVLDGLIGENDTELMKVEKIFHWVQNNIKYIAFEDGMRGLIPHNAEYVCDKRYGDCKDMATIVVNMLNAAGVEAYFTWIGTRDIPYQYTKYPSPLVDNHMIATYIHDSKYYFLDATSQYSSYKLPSSMTQGKEALIALSETEFEIKTVPVIAKEQNLKKDSAHYTLKDGQLLGTGKVTFGGYPKVFNTYNLIKSNQKAVDEFVTRFLNRGSNKCFVDQYDIEHLDDLEQPIEITYNLRIEDYYRTIGNKVYINLNLEKNLVNDIIEDTRKLPIENEFKYVHENIAVLEIPEGYEVKNLPESVIYNNKVFGFDLSYQLQGNKIILTRKLFVDYLILETEDFKTWNEGIKRLAEASRDALILEKEGA